MKFITLKLEQYPRIKKWYPMISQLIKFCLVGVFNTFLHFGIYYCLTRYLGLQFLLANALAFMLAASSSYLLNKFWTFEDKSKDHRKQYSKFISVATVGLIINEGLMYLFVSALGLYDLLALIIAALVVVFWNFLMNRYWTFRVHEKKTDNSEMPLGQDSNV